MANFDASEIKAIRWLAEKYKTGNMHIYNDLAHDFAKHLDIDTADLTYNYQLIAVWQRLCELGAIEHSDGGAAMFIGGITSPKIVDIAASIDVQDSRSKPSSRRRSFAKWKYGLLVIAFIIITIVVLLPHKRSGVIVKLSIDSAIFTHKHGDGGGLEGMLIIQPITRYSYQEVNHVVGWSKYGSEVTWSASGPKDTSISFTNTETIPWIKIQDDDIVGAGYEFSFKTVGTTEQFHGNPKSIILYRNNNWQLEPPNKQIVMGVSADDRITFQATIDAVSTDNTDTITLLWNNREWLFSGIGVVILVGATKLLVNSRHKSA